MSGEATLHHVDEPFSLVPSSTLQQTPTMSYRAKGVLTTLLSYPTGWRFSMKHLQSLGTEGRDALRSAMKELRAHGYVKYTRIVDPETNQQKGTRINVSRYPKEDWIKKDRQPGFPGDGFSGDRDPVAIRSTGVRSTEVPSGSSASSPEPKQEKPREAKPKKPNNLGILIGQAIGIWNADKHPSWPELKKMTGRGAKYLKEFLAHFDGDPEVAAKELSAAVRYTVKHEDWWRDKGVVGFDELAANNKLESYADKARSRRQAQGEKLEEGQEGGNTPQDPLLGRRVRSTYGWLAILKHKELNRYWAEYQPDPEQSQLAPPEPGWLYDYEIAEVLD